MKLFLSALLLAAATAAFAQNPSANPNQQAAQRADGPGIIINDLVAHKVLPADQSGCPLYLESAYASSAAGLLPVDARVHDGGTLSLHFRNQSGKAIRSAAITAHLRVKTNIYDLDAHALDLRLTISGTTGVDRALSQVESIALPQHIYLFGVAQVTLDQVTFEDGSVWMASAASNTCATSGPSSEKVELK
ncbi:MAG: hypothetical protein WA294_08050 [Acidobacteriaceae bacterium]